MKGLIVFELVDWVMKRHLREKGLARCGGGGWRCRWYKELFEVDSMRWYRALVDERRPQRFRLRMDRFFWKLSFLLLRQSQRH